jgi:hypothetical protein
VTQDDKVLLDVDLADFAINEGMVEADALAAGFIGIFMS